MYDPHSLFWDRLIVAGLLLVNIAAIAFAVLYR